MVTGSKQVLLSEAISANGTTTTSSSALPPGSKNLILLLTISDHTAGSFDLTVEHSPDGINWETLGTVATASADGIEFTRITDSSFHLFRAVLIASGGANATVECAIAHTPNRL